LLNGTSFTIIDVPDGVLTKAFGINNAGKIVGSYVDKKTGKYHGFLATPAP
jgi:probable HAF family extracellular repeat protein